MNSHFNFLYTPAGESLAAERDAIPWDVYPRPCLRRNSFFNLNGWWDFATNDGESVPAIYDRLIRVPFSPESLLSGVNEIMTPGISLWYRRAFRLPEGFHKGRILLHIGAADQIAYVYLNGGYVGEHVGGYESFTLDITDHLQQDNTLEILVVDHLPDTSLPYGKQCYKRGGMWYTPVSGLWQTVWLESVPETYVRSLTTVVDGDCVHILAEGVTDGVVTVATPDGNLMVPLQDGEAVVELTEPRMWCPEDPYLYEYSVSSGDDEVQSYFAVRHLEIRHVNGLPRMCLNGKPVFFHGVLDQGYWSDGLFTPATPSGFAEDIQQMQRLGFNTLRKHIKVEPELFYYACDRMGMLVWQDMVNNGRYSFLRDTALPTLGLQRLCDRHMHRDAKTREAFLTGMRCTVRQLDKHPCVVGWTIFNEGWGQFDSDRMNCELRLMDPTRFIDTASGWFAGAQTDVDSKHVYFKPYRFKPSKKPVFLSEFGGYSYKPEGHVFNTEKTYGYRMYDDADTYMDDVEQLYLKQIVPAVNEGLCGAIYTQLSDVEDETNGLLSYDRRVCKVDAARMRRLAEELVIKEETE